MRCQQLCVYRNRKVHEAGWLEMLQPNKTWQKRYFVFENEVIKYSLEEEARDEFWTVIQIRDVVSFRVESLSGVTTSLVVLTREHNSEKKITIRAESQDDMNKWQFALHKTVAVLFPKLLESRRTKLLEIQQANSMRNVNNPPSIASSCSRQSSAPISIGITHNVSDLSDPGGGVGITTTTTTISGMDYESEDRLSSAPIRMERRRSSSDHNHMGNLNMSNFLLDSSLDLGTSDFVGADSDSTAADCVHKIPQSNLSRTILIPEGGGGELTSLNTMDGHVSRSLQYTTRRFLKGPGPTGEQGSGVPSGTATTETTPPPPGLHEKKFSFDCCIDQETEGGLNASFGSKTNSMSASLTHAGMSVGSVGRSSGLTAALQASASASVSASGSISGSISGSYLNRSPPKQQYSSPQLQSHRMHRFDSGRSDSSESSNPFKDTGPISAEDLLECSDDRLDRLEESLESLEELDQSFGDSTGMSKEFIRAHSDSEELFDFDDGSNSPIRRSRSGSAATGPSTIPAGASVIGGLPLGIGNSSGAAGMGAGGTGVGSFQSNSLLHSAHSNNAAASVNSATAAGTGTGTGIPYNRIAGSVHKSSGIMNSLGKMNVYMGIPNASSLQWKIGACSLRGKRTCNEDRYVVIGDLRDDISSLSDTHRQPSAHQKLQELPERLACNVNTSAATDDNDNETDHLELMSKLYVHHQSQSENPSSSNMATSVEREAFFAVYDGHCGDTASIHCANNLHLAIARHPQYRTDLPVAIIETCCAFDQEVVDYSVSINRSPGTTALGIFIIGSQLTLFGIGDCHAMLCKQGSICKDLSKGHKPGMESEKSRILSGGGWVTEEKELYLARLHQMDLLDPVIQKAVEQMNFVTINRYCQ